MGMAIILIYVSAIPFVSLACWTLFVMLWWIKHNVTKVDPGERDGPPYLPLLKLFGYVQISCKLKTRCIVQHFATPDMGVGEDISHFFLWKIEKTNLYHLATTFGGNEGDISVLLVLIQNIITNYSSDNWEYNVDKVILLINCKYACSWFKRFNHLTSLSSSDRQMRRTHCRKQRPFRILSKPWRSRNGRTFWGKIPYPFLG